MKRLILVYKKYYIKDTLFKYYSSTINLAIFVDWLFIPYFTQLMGMYSTIVFITMFYLVSESSGFMLQYFRKYSLIKTFYLLFLFDILQVLIFSTYFYNEKIMLYGLMFIFSIQAMFYEIINNKIVKYYEKNNKKFSTIQSMLYLSKSYIILLGLITSLVFELIFNNMKYLIIIIIVLMLFSLYNEYKLIKFLKG